MSGNVSPDLVNGLVNTERAPHPYKMFHAEGCGVVWVE